MGVARSRFPPRELDQKGCGSTSGETSVLAALPRLLCSRAVTLAFAVWLLCRKRNDSLPVSTMWQWCVRRSSSAVVNLASPKTAGHSEAVSFSVVD